MHIIKVTRVPNLFSPNPSITLFFTQLPQGPHLVIREGQILASLNAQQLQKVRLINWHMDRDHSLFDMVLTMSLSAVNTQRLAELFGVSSTFIEKQIELYQEAIEVIKQASRLPMDAEIISAPAMMRGRLFSHPRGKTEDKDQQVKPSIHRLSSPI